MALVLSSGAFAAGGAIPARHSCDGANASPALTWSGAPAGTVAFALIVDDPDAPGGTWVHWVLYNLPGTQASLPEGVPTTERLAGLGGALQGRNDFHRIGYGGPCPPPGRAHHYVFRLFALNAALSLAAGATRPALERAMAGHVVAEARLVGTYARQAR